MKYKILCALLIVVFFVGCSQKESVYAKATDIVKEQALTQAKKLVIREGKIIRAFIVVTHMNNIKNELVSKDNEVERFIIGVHIPSDGNQDLYKNISFSINDKKIEKITILDKKNPLLKILPAYSTWSKYFLIESKKDNTKRGVIFSMTMANLRPVKINFNDSYGNLPPMINIGFSTVETEK